ncbi:TonB-dependent receptor [Flavobacterium laiguense]|uniref:TonB-dependent receptor n=1 Tax=Flavobacterium laiguense TaxID=2169409 RepID=A0A2U1JZ92_9FLAO|nr:TonB-dependent receptor [Flavobacterium laiguense]PWA10264.1 TonB-dependent receptor [Flavobacterium laiguense]
MKLKFLFFTLLICAIGFSQNKGTITGVLLDKDSNNQSLPFANVLIKDTKIGANTDIDGKYTITIAPGNYTVQFSFLGYETVEVPVTVAANETITLNNSLGSGSYKLKDVVIKSSGGREKETALLLDQKNAVVIKQSIGAQEMSRKGVSDVEEGLTKITGITKVGSRGLFVRGLEDRYNNLLINDLAAPTNNPFLKIIPLDLFSTDIVGVIEVYKTFSPNIYGDFAGGTFNIQTSRGSKSITKLNIGTSYTVNSNLKSFSLSKDADSAEGFFGFTADNRELPSLLGDTPSSRVFTPQESLDSFKSGFDVSEIKSPLNTSIGLLHSEKFNLNNGQNFSYLFSINAENNFGIQEGVDRTFRYQSTGIDYKTDFVTTDNHYKTALTGLLGLNYSTNRLKLSLNSLYIKTTDNLIKDQYGVANAETGTGANETLIRTNQLDQSNYWNNQLVGEYALSEDKNQTIKAGVSYAKTKYDQPDRKAFSGVTTPNDGISASIAGNNFIKQYLEITGNSYLSGLTEYNLKFGGKDKSHKLTVGYNGNASDMESSYRFISPTVGPNINAPLNSIDEQLNAYIASEAFYYKESSNATYKAKLKEAANAGYANLLYKFNEKFEANGGVRVESTNRETQYRQQGSFDDPFQTLKYDKVYFLPSLNAKYSVTENANVRFAGGITYTKPVIMEAYPIEYINADGTSMQGNPFLLNSDNYNLDLKYELFPTAKEMFAVGLFGKKMENPIERTFTSNAAGSTIISYLNSENAVLYGAEIEFIYDLGRINGTLSDFSLGFNTSLMGTKAEVNPKNSLETHTSRDLQGASNWLINSDLKYQFELSKSWSNTVSLVYSVFGKRIYAVGTIGLDHIYELPVQQLDFVWSSKLSEHFDLKFSADNLIDPARQFELGDNSLTPIVEDSALTRSYKKGRGFSLNLGYTF